ncbi:MAG: hypothetical protein ACLGIV_01835 [Actinomycetes bacterium]
MGEEARTARLVALAVTAVLLFGYPVLAVFDVAVLVLGVPLVWLYLFGVWLAVIVVAGLTVRGR